MSCYSLCLYNRAVYGMWLWLATGQSGEKHQ